MTDVDQGQASLDFILTGRQTDLRAWDQANNGVCRCVIRSSFLSAQRHVIIFQNDPVHWCKIIRMIRVTSFNMI